MFVLYNKIIIIKWKSFRFILRLGFAKFRFQLGNKKKLKVKHKNAKTKNQNEWIFHISFSLLCFSILFVMICKNKKRKITKNDRIEFQLKLWFLFVSIWFNQMIFCNRCILFKTNPHKSKLEQQQQKREKKQ